MQQNPQDILVLGVVGESERIYDASAVIKLTGLGTPPNENLLIEFSFFRDGNHHLCKDSTPHLRKRLVFVPDILIIRL